MSKLKGTKISLIICTILMIIALIPIFVADEYDYSTIDLTKQENQIAIDGEIEFDVYRKSNGDNAVEFDFDLFNLTNRTLNNVVIYIELKDVNGNEEMFYTDAMAIEPRTDVEKELVADCDEDEYYTISVYAQIGDGEVFAVSNLDELVKDNSIFGISSLVFVVLLIAVIVLSVRVGRASKKRLEIENQAYAKRVNDMIDLDIEREKVMIEREKVTNEMLKQNNSQENNAVKNIKCEYCGNVNDAKAERCSVCGALIKK